MRPVRTTRSDSTALDFSKRQHTPLQCWRWLPIRITNVNPRLPFHLDEHNRVFHQIDWFAKRCPNEVAQRTTAPRVIEHRDGRTSLRRPGRDCDEPALLATISWKRNWSNESCQTARGGVHWCIPSSSREKLDEQNRPLPTSNLTLYEICFTPPSQHP